MNGETPQVAPDEFFRTDIRVGRILRAIAVGSADVAQQYLKAGLLDEIHVNLVPVLLGAGVPFFGHLEDRHFGLECTRVVASDGVTHLRYRVLR